MIDIVPGPRYRLRVFTRSRPAGGPILSLGDVDAAKDSRSGRCQNDINGGEMGSGWDGGKGGSEWMGGWVGWSWRVTRLWSATKII